MMKSQYGLSRHIPAAVARAVRQRCGFGCVICGSAPYEYDHFAPEFADAHSHEPEGITLLCSNHHASKTRGRLSSEKVFRSNLAPAAQRRGYAREALDLGDTQPEIELGKYVAAQTSNILTLHGRRIVTVSQSTDGGPFLLNAEFWGKGDDLIAQIVDNEWRGRFDLFDTRFKGRTLEVLSEENELALAIELLPPRGLRIRRLQLQYRGASVAIGGQGEVKLRTSSGDEVTLGGGRIVGAESFIELGDGLSLGRGGQMTISEFNYHR